MKKKTIANLIMVAVILTIAAVGILGVGHIRGWFDKADEAIALLTDIRGVINMERNGVIYPVESDTVLRAGDKIAAGSGATAAICMGSDQIILGGGAMVNVADPACGNFCAAIDSGEVFVNTVQEITLTFDSEEVVIADATAALSVRSGAQTVRVFRGTVAGAAAGKSIEYVGGETFVQSMQLNSLNDFLITQIRAANATVTLCYTNQDLDELADKRQQALQDLINSMTPTQPSETEPTQPPQTDPPKPPETDPTQPSDTTPTQPSETVPDAPPTTEPTELAEPPATAPTQTEPAEPSEPQPPAAEPAGSCYITIRCDTILNNMENLEPGKAEFVPADGIILPVVEVPFYDGETVFDVLQRICKIAEIQLEYSWTPLYNSYYIEGIHNLYEFDCGFESGWMYKVNEWFPNYGCSSYYVKDGDVIVWCYTCVGLGADVGDVWMGEG